MSPGSHTPHGYLEQRIRLAQLTKSIRQNLYDGPLHGGQRLTQMHFNEATKSLEGWLKDVPPHLHLSISVSPLYRRSISILHLRYWSTVMLVTKPFLLCSLLRGNELAGTPKQPTFEKLARTCLSAAESSFHILESMVLHNVVSSLVVADYFFALQALQVLIAAHELYREGSYQDHIRRCLKILLAIGVSGYPKHLLPETLFQLQKYGLSEGAPVGTSLQRSPGPSYHPLGSGESMLRYVTIFSREFCSIVSHAYAGPSQTSMLTNSQTVGSMISTCLMPPLMMGSWRILWICPEYSTWTLLTKKDLWKD